MGSYHMGPPEDLVLDLQKTLGLEDFVETGTYQGGTAAWAGAYFARVTTIELSPAFHAAAVERFRAQPNVCALAGGSVAVLREVVPTLTRSALFWLDAHWSGQDTAGREAECPVLAEIAVINASPQAHVILVDDARLFCAPPPRPHRADQWPDLATVLDALGTGGRHVVLFEDVLVAVPNTVRDHLVAWLQEAATQAASRPASRTGWWRRLLRS